jgi:hypothetical protein
MLLSKAAANSNFIVFSLNQLVSIYLTRDDHAIKSSVYCVGYFDNNMVDGLASTSEITITIEVCMFVIPPVMSLFHTILYGIVHPQDSSIYLL